MSQILDALRRAEAQRSRGRVPGLHETTGQVTLTPGPTAAPGSRRPLVIAAVLLLALVLSGALFLMLRTADSDSKPVRAGEVPVAANARGGDTGLGAASDAVAIQLPDPKAAAAADPPAPVGLPRKAQLPAPAPTQTPTDLTARLPESRIEPREPPAARVVAERAQPAAAIDSPARPLAPAPAPSRSGAGSVPDLPARQDLPPEVQRSLPPITVSGTVYSSDPAQRMLVVNGELWREGDQIRPGLVLEQIRRRDAVLRFNGVRFTVGP